MANGGMAMTGAGMAATRAPTRATRYCCWCGVRLSHRHVGDECAECAERTRDLLYRPPEVPQQFWTVDRVRDALESWHMGRVIAAYRIHPYHRRPLSQEVVGRWIGMSQAQLSRIEHGPPIKDLDRLTLWARTLRIPPEFLWFKIRDRY